jgi:hypothetical protein
MKNKQIIFSSEQLGRAILWGTIFFSIWFTDFDNGGELGPALFILLLYFLFGGFFLDAMSKLWKYEKIKDAKRGN